MRRIFLAALAALALYGVAACGTSTASEAGTGGSSGVLSNSGNTKNPPAHDVVISKCEINNVYGLDIARAKIKVTNHSSKPSDYTIQAEFIDSDGTRMGDGLTFVTKVRPGQTVMDEIVGDSGGAPKASCRLLSVERFSSEG